MNNKNLIKRLKIAASQNIKEKEFWIKKFSGQPIKSYFPYDILNCKLGGDNIVFDKYSFKLNITQYSRLSEITSNSDHKLHIILLTTLILLLGRYTGNRDIMVCTPIYRIDNIKELMNTVLPLRCFVDNSNTPREMFKEVGKEVINATNHQNYPVELLLQQLELGVKNVYTMQPDAGLVLENIHNGEHIHQIPFNIIFLFWRKGCEIRVNVEYNTGLYHKKTIEQISNHFIYLLGEIVSDIGKNISQVSLMADTMKEKFIQDLNSNWTEPYIEKSLIELLEDQVERTPHYISIVVKESYLTFQMVQKKSHGLALLLRNRCIVAGTTVGLEAGRSSETVIGFFAILKTGGTCLSLSPVHLSNQGKRILEQTSTNFLLSENQQSLQELGDNVIHINHHILNKENDLFKLPIESPNPASAYIYLKEEAPEVHRLITLQHQQVISFLTRIKPVIYENNNIASNVALVSSLSTDEGLKHLLGALFAGHPVNIIPDELRKNALPLLTFFNKHQIRVSDASTFLIQRMIAHIKNLGKKIFFPVTKFFVFGGYLPLPSVIRFFDCIQNGALGITIVYGTPGECNAASVLEVTRESIGRLQPIPMGKPVPGFHFHIDDHVCQPLPVGVPGELCVISEFTEPGSVQRTGIIVQRQTDSSIEFLGYIHQQVVLKNVKIYLDAIVVQLLNHEYINEAIVLKLPDAIKSEVSENSLCAYFVARKHIPVPHIKEYLSKQLPDFLIPAYYLQLEEIPLIHDYQVDTDKLFSLDISTVREFEAPKDFIEEKLVEIWADVLEKDQTTISTNDSFFGLGGQSIQTIMLSSRIYKEFNISIPIPEIFELDVVKHIAEYINKAVKTRYSSIEPAEEKEYYVLSSSQRRLHVLQLMEPDSIGYNVPEIVEIKGKLDRNRLKKSFNRLIERHDTLRTSFEIVENVPVQKINRQIDFSMEYWCLAKGNREQEEKNIIKKMIRPFDLSKAPLMRLGLVRKEESYYILIVDRHHIISDATSRGILLKELHLIYDGKKLSPLSLQYKDYSEWQNSRKHEVLLKEQTSYWLKQFSGDIPELNLPTDYPRPPIQEFAGREITFNIGKEDSGKLKVMVSQESTTIFILILAIFNIFLSRLCNQEDIIVGTPVVGRQHVELENIIGIFINTLALRNYPKSQDRFIQFLREVKTSTLNGFENQMYQFEDLVEKITVQRDLSRNPIFDVMFSFIDNRSGVEEIQKLKSRDLFIKPYTYKMETSKFDLSLFVYEGEDQLHFKVEYRTQLFRDDTILRYIKYFKNIISSVIEFPGKKICDIELMSNEDKARILYEFNNTGVEYSFDKSYIELFSGQAVKTPDGIALVGGSGLNRFNQYKDKESIFLSYHQLHNKSDQLALQLIELGVRTCDEEIIGLMSDRTIEMVIGLLGILKSGAAYLPIGPEYPLERVRYMLEHTGISILIVSDSSDSFIKDSSSLKFIDMSEEIDQVSTAFEEPINLSIQSSPCDLIYVMYTSGTTGIPKGVMIENRSIVNFIKGITDIIPFGINDRILSLTTVSFDIFGVEVLLPLVMGSGVIIGNDDEQLDTGLTAKVLLREQVSIFQLTPSRLQLFLSYPGASVCMKGIRHLIVTGEAFPLHLLERIRTFTNGKIYNGYGPTETTIWSTIKDVTDDTIITIGKPLANTHIYIVDRANRLQPVGIPGELCIAGYGLARGYFKDEVLTDEKFIRNFIGDICAKDGYNRLYRTGDLARWMSDGNIEFLGRIDHQIKLRGYRIELEEIEMQLLNIEGIKEAVVILNEINCEKYLCAYVIIDKSETSIVEGSSEMFKTVHLKKELGKRLPMYMIPSFFIQLDQIPLTVTGKINRRELPVPEMVNDNKYTAPRNVLEKQLVETWSEVLKIKACKLSVNENFFSIGGNSLKATIMISILYRKLEVRLPLSKLFETPTIRGLAANIQEIPNVKYQSVNPIEKKQYYPLSPAQKRLYILQQMDISGIAYNMPYYLPLAGDISKEILESVFLKLIKRHEGFRTFFQLINDDPVQRIHDDAKFKIIDIKAKEAIESSTSVIGHLKDFTRVFDLSKAPLFRIGYLKIGNSQYLIVDMHHIISDGTSTGILREEFLSVLSGEEFNLLKIQYKDYIEWQGKAKYRELLKKQEMYWLGIYQDELPQIDFPIDFSRPKILNFAGSSLQFKLTIPHTQGLNNISKKYSCTMFQTILTVFYIFLGKLVQQSDIIIGVPIACRRFPESQNIIGFFVNTLALRNFPTGNKKFNDFLLEVKENTIEAFDNQEYPFDELVERLLNQREPGRNPLFDIMFAFHNQVELIPKEHSQVPGTFNDESFNFERSRSLFDLILHGYEAEDNLTFSFEYNTKLYKKRTIELFVRLFKDIVDIIIENNEILLEQIKFYSEILEPSLNVPEFCLNI